VKILVSAGEASGDRYSAQLVERLRERLPQAEFFGCAGRRLREAGVRPVIRAEELAVVGIFEVARDIPRIYGQFRRLAAAAVAEKPALAVLTDSPDFNLRLAKKLHRAGIPVVYYVAPQVWAWRRRRVRLLRESVDHLLCIFPFEEKFFRRHGVETTFVGHPLYGSLHPTLSRQEFCRRHGLAPEKPLIALLPGSRRGEASRHLGPVLDAVARLTQQRPMNFVLPASTTTGREFFAQRISDPAVQVIEGETENALANADLALVASGSATVEAALLGAPMVVFYRVTAASWMVGRMLVDVPFYSMVNLLAQRRIVPELIQSDCTGERLATEAGRLLESEQARRQMKQDLELVRQKLRGEMPAAQRAAEVICNKLNLTGIPARREEESLPVG
jgi:lipid-A-disaccharide synthase